MRVKILRGIREDHLAGDARVGRERLLEDGVPHDDHAKSGRCAEELRPALRAHEPLDLRIADDDRAAFVEDRQHVAQAPALAAFFRDLARMHRVDACLRPWKREPDQSVEEVVVVLGARADLTRLEEMHLVVRVRGRGRNEADGFSAFRLYLPFCGEGIQQRERRRVAEPLQPRAVGPENRMA
ncbi:MAG TPA: hypothetical protein VHN19_10595 [Burkholderiales bacterium]|nr:hypothetical protein [Burkholderiales bacterium]